jgi:ethanolamine utilization protein EutP (predicted NTPase)
LNPNFINLSSSITGTYDLVANTVEFFKHFDHDKPTALFHGRIIKYVEIAVLCVAHSSRYTGKLSIDMKNDEIVLVGKTELTQVEIGNHSQNLVGDGGDFILTTKIVYTGD